MVFTVLVVMDPVRQREFINQQSARMAEQQKKIDSLIEEKKAYQARYEELTAQRMALQARIKQGDASVDIKRYENIKKLQRNAKKLENQLSPRIRSARRRKEQFQTSIDRQSAITQRKEDLRTGKVEPKLGDVEDAARAEQRLRLKQVTGSAKTGREVYIQRIKDKEAAKQPVMPINEPQGADAVLTDSQGRKIGVSAGVVGFVQRRQEEAFRAAAARRVIQEELPVGAGYGSAAIIADAYANQVSREDPRVLAVRERVAFREEQIGRSGLPSSVRRAQARALKSGASAYEGTVLVRERGKALAEDIDNPITATIVRRTSDIESATGALAQNIAVGGVFRSVLSIPPVRATAVRLLTRVGASTVAWSALPVAAAGVGGAFITNPEAATNVAFDLAVGGAGFALGFRLAGAPLGALRSTPVRLVQSSVTTDAPAAVLRSTSAQAVRVRGALVGEYNRYFVQESALRSIGREGTLRVGAVREVFPSGFSVRGRGANTFRGAFRTVEGLPSFYARSRSGAEFESRLLFASRTPLPRGGEVFEGAGVSVIRSPYGFARGGAFKQTGIVNLGADIELLTASDYLPRGVARPRLSRVSSRDFGDAIGRYVDTRAPNVVRERVRLSDSFLQSRRGSLSPPRTRTVINPRVSVFEGDVSLRGFSVPLRTPSIRGLVLPLSIPRIRSNQPTSYASRITSDINVNQELFRVTSPLIEGRIIRTERRPITIQEPRITPLIDQRLLTAQATQQLTNQENLFPITPSFPTPSTPPPTLGGGFPLLPMFAPPSSGRGGRPRGRQRFRYSSSLIAGFLNIKGKKGRRSAITSGIAIRPLEG